MRYCLIAFLLASSILLSSCSTSKQLSNQSNAIASPLAGLSKTALYKVNIKVYGDFFSGLVLFKYNADKHDYNIVFLTEVGLTLCEFYWVNNSIEVRNASSLFQSKMAQKTIAQDFGLLLNHPEVRKQLSELEYKNNDNVRYTVNDQMKPLKIKKKQLINGVVVNLPSYKNGVPEHIEFKHRGIKFSMSLSLLKQN